MRLETFRTSSSSACLPLAHRRHRDQARHLPHFLEQRVLPLGLEVRLEIGRDVEVVFDHALATAGDDDDVGQARRHRFFDAVLDDRLVDQREHLLRLRLGRRKEARAEARGRKHRLTDG